MKYSGEMVWCAVLRLQLQFSIRDFGDLVRSMDGINSVDMLSGKIIVCEDLHLLLLLNKITSVLVNNFFSGLDEFVGSKSMRFGSLIKYLLKFEPSKIK